MEKKEKRRTQISCRLPSPRRTPRLPENIVAFPTKDITLDAEARPMRDAITTEVTIDRTEPESGTIVRLIDLNRVN